MESIFTKPQLCKAKAGWYIYFYYNSKQYRFKKRINQEYKDLKERETQFSYLAAALWLKLKNGWNPETNQNNATSGRSFNDALDFALEEKRASTSTKTYSGYKSTIKYIKQAAKAVRMDLKPISKMTRRELRLVIDKAKVIRSWDNDNYNKNVTYLQAVLAVLIDVEIEPNLFMKMRRMPKGEDSILHAPPTPEQFEIIKPVLEQHPDFYNYVKTIFFTLCREVELLRLTVDMIDLNRRVINMPARITKGRKKPRVVPINDYLLAIFNEMEVNTYPGDFYVFGTRKKPGYIDRHHAKWFIPSPYPIHVNRVTEKWKVLIKDGLGLTVTLYAMKSAGADALLRSGAALSVVSAVCGHQDERTTKKHYVSVLEEMQRAEAIKSSRDFGT